MTDYSRVRTKLAGFAQLAKDWDFGAGMPIDPAIITEAERYIDYAEEHDLCCDVSPCGHGGASISFHTNGNASLELTLKPDGTVDLDVEYEAIEKEGLPGRVIGAYL